MAEQNNNQDEILELLKTDSQAAMVRTMVRASSRADTFFSVFIGRSSFSSFACIDGK